MIAAELCNAMLCNALRYHSTELAPDLEEEEEELQCSTNKNNHTVPSPTSMCIILVERCIAKFLLLS